MEQQQPISPVQPEVDKLADALSSTTIEGSSPQPESPAHASPRPLRIYTRAQLLSLHNSPLVKPPPDMPELKQWFGTENEQNLSKKDTDTTPSNNSRDRRFRRDHEDGENPSRPNFRSTLSQPSQMGNFKHQSLRDRDKDRDDKDRDARDKDGHERLRHLSDKYDRDRLGMAAPNARNRDREGGLSTTTARTTQANANSTSSRRSEGRDANKRKGEGGDDWRRDAPRSAREDKNDNPRKEREERARSRQRDSSRSRGDTGRRERAGDREEDDDSRHWRDDGKRDDRLASRRTRDRQGNEAWEPSNDRERRWQANDERDSRTKRTNGRDRRAGGDDVKERDDRRDREKEKEPAWMDSSVPSEPLPGILGGKASNGELDGIQAWKKDMKDKEKQEKEKERATSEAPQQDPVVEAPQITTAPPMDEIQMFRLMMQKEQGKVGADTTPDVQQQLKLSEGPQLSTKMDHGHVLPGPSASQPLIVSGPVTPSLDSAPSNSPFVPPAGSRLLAFGRGPVKPVAPEVPVQAPAPLAATSLPPGPPSRGQPSRGSSGITPFDEHSAQYQPSLDNLASLGGLSALEAQQRVHLDRSLAAPQYNTTQDHLMADLNSNGHNVAKGSRFAKFFDPKSREPLPVTAKSQSPIGFVSSSPALGQRPDHLSYNPPNEAKNTMDDIYAMLRESQSNQNPNVNLGHPSLVQQQQHAGFNGHSNIQALHSQQQHGGRMESLYDSRLDDRSFVPNDLVPGLRTYPQPQRSREGYSDALNDPILQLQRLSQQQQQHQQLPLRGEPSYNAQLNTLYNQPLNQRSLQPQPQYRGSGNANASHPMLQSQNPQRLPPGLANLGNRPPHEPSQFLGLGGGGGGGPLGGMGNNMHIPQQQQFNNFPSNNPQFNAQQFRGGMPPINLQGLQQSNGPHSMNSIGQPNLDPRLSNQHYASGMGTGQRLPNNMPVQRVGPHQQLNMRGPQQQHQLHPQLLQHMDGPLNIPQQHGQGPRGDLMAILLRGTNPSE